MAKLQDQVTAEDHIQGDEGAEVTLVEYGDYQCPHCAIGHVVVKRLQRHFGSRMRFVYRNFPLEEIHPLAEPAAEAAEFAGAQGRFWEMHDGIFENQRALSERKLVELAEGLGLDGEAMAQAMEEQRFGDRILREAEGGARSGVHGTPTYFVNGEQIDAREYDELREAMEAVVTR